MDVANIAKLATSMAETGIRQEVGVTMLKKSMDIQAVSAAQLLDALQCGFTGLKEQLQVCARAAGRPRRAEACAPAHSLVDA